MTAYYDGAVISPYFPLLSLYKPPTMAHHSHRVLHEPLLLAAIVAVQASSAQTNPLMGGHNLCVPGTSSSTNALSYQSCFTL